MKIAPIPNLTVDQGTPVRYRVTLSHSGSAQGLPLFHLGPGAPSGAAIHTPTYDVEGHLIWGATARILGDLLDRV